ncbi:MAG: hypothetical protein ABJH45_04520 [Paracoccaceae bacterium]
MASAAGTADIATLAKWIVNGSPDALASVRSAKASGIKTVVSERSKSHSEKAETEYESEVTKVSSNQGSDTKNAKAQEQMNTIQAQVATSLKEARSKTDDLFI